MKKVIFSLAVLGLATLVACSDEEDLPTVPYIGCQVCEVEGVAPDFIPEDYEICVAKQRVGEGENSTEAEVVYVDGANTGISPQRYFALFCDNAYGEVTNPGEGGGNNNGGGGQTGNENCVTCAAYTQSGTGTAVPEFDVCQGENGNAFVGGVDMQVAYAQYLAALSTETVCQ